MNDIVLLLGNTLIGGLLIGLWYTDRPRIYFAYWGIGQILLGASASIATLIQAPECVGFVTPLKVCISPITGLGMAAMLGGSLRYRGYAFGWVATVATTFLYVAAIYLSRFFFPPLLLWIVAFALTVSLLSISWALLRDTLLEKIAAALFALRALDAVWLTFNASDMHNAPQMQIGYLLSFSAATCLLLAVFQRKSRELGHNNDLLSFSNKLITALQSPSDEKNLAAEALHQLTINTPNRSALLHLIDPSGRWFDLIAAEGHSNQVMAVAERMPVDATLSGKAVRLRKTVQTEDYANEPGAWQELASAFSRAGIVSNISVPLIIEQRPLGVLNISYPDRHEFTQHELETLQSAGQVIGTCLDRVRNLRDLAYRANHDALTGLGNREALHEYVATLELETSSDTLAMLLIDLDRFREVNDTLGHKTGDHLLCELANMLTKGIASEAGRAFRLGGDEFAIILPYVENEDAGRNFAQKLAETISQRVQVGETALRIDLSIGVSLSKRRSLDSHELLRCADVAMYQAKTTGKQVEVYERSRDQHSAQRLKLLAHIPEAIRREEFVMFYQPQLALGENTLVGCEALIRWQHPERGLLPPGEFLPLAEVSDVIRPMTEWVIDSSMKQQRAWQDAKLNLRIAFNLSARNILDPKLMPHLLAMLEKHGLKAEQIELELTETALLHDPATSELILNQLASCGFVLALDDFGTGFSSLTYLKRYPFSVLKIDRSFVSDMHNDIASLEIVRSTIQLAHALGMKVVAEGVEDGETLATLRDLGCDYAQGYFIGRPMPADQLLIWKKEALVLGSAG